MGFDNQKKELFNFNAIIAVCKLDNGSSSVGPRCFPAPEMSGGRVGSGKPYMSAPTGQATSLAYFIFVLVRFQHLAAPFPPVVALYVT